MTTGGVGMINAIERTMGIMMSKLPRAMKVPTAEIKPNPYLRPMTTAKLPACFFCSRSCGWKNKPNPKIVMIWVHAALFSITFPSTSGRSSVVTPKQRIAIAVAKDMVTGICATLTIILDNNIVTPAATRPQFGAWHSSGAAKLNATSAGFTGASPRPLVGDTQASKSLAWPPRGSAVLAGLPEDAAVDAWPLWASAAPGASSGVASACSPTSSKPIKWLGPWPRNTGSNGGPIVLVEVARIRTSWMFAMVGRLSISWAFAADSHRA
mmetsp:Transcript_92387/g.265766  ORF Transcript_92387/g.265766 Transcript_92387/m.265766 type:complete len:267 (-) Transcript_92387:475-1275(-)